MKKVKEAKWIKINEDEYKCSICGYIVTLPQGFPEKCPNCRAVMKKDE